MLIKNIKQVEFPSHVSKSCSSKHVFAVSERRVSIKTRFVEGQLCLGRNGDVAQITPLLLYHVGELQVSTMFPIYTLPHSAVERERGYLFEKTGQLLCNKSERD